MQHSVNVNGLDWPIMDLPLGERPAFEGIDTVKVDGTDDIDWHQTYNVLSNAFYGYREESNRIIDGLMKWITNNATHAISATYGNAGCVNGKTQFLRSIGIRTPDEEVTTVIEVTETRNPFVGSTRGDNDDYNDDYDDDDRSLGERIEEIIEDAGGVNVSEIGYVDGESLATIRSRAARDALADAQRAVNGVATS